METGDQRSCAGTRLELLLSPPDSTPRSPADNSVLEDGAAVAAQGLHMDGKLIALAGILSGITSPLPLLNRSSSHAGDHSATRGWRLKGSRDEQLFDLYWHLALANLERLL